jgi:hypothetical protein
MIIIINSLSTIQNLTAVLLDELNTTIDGIEVSFNCTDSGTPVFINKSVTQNG